MKLSPLALAFILCAAFAASSPIPAESAEKETGEKKTPVLETTEPASWDTVRDGEPAVELPKLIKEAAKRTDAKYQTIGSVRTMRIDEEYFHWLYTAFTRATEQLFLVNWPKEQIEE